MSYCQLFTKYLLALKQEKKLNEFIKQRKILLDVIHSKKSFAFSATVYAEDQYIPPAIRSFAQKNEINQSFETTLCINDEKKEVILIQYIPYLNEEKPPRQILIQFVDLAKEYIKILDDIANQELSLFREIF